MKKFILIYEGGTSPQSEEEGKMIMDKWMLWFGSLGEKLVDGGFPFSPGAMVTDGNAYEVCELNLTGYSIIKAENMEEAMEIAKGCPNLLVKSKLHIFEELPIEGM